MSLKSIIIYVKFLNAVRPMLINLLISIVFPYWDFSVHLHNQFNLFQNNRNLFLSLIYSVNINSLFFWHVFTF